MRIRGQNEGRCKHHSKDAAAASSLPGRPECPGTQQKHQLEVGHWHQDLGKDRRNKYKSEITQKQGGGDDVKPSRV